MARWRIATPSAMVNELQKLVNFATGECGFPQWIFETPVGQIEKPDFSFCFFDEEDTEFEHFYGDLNTLFFMPDLKFITMKNSRSQETPGKSNHEINERVIACIDSVSDSDKDYGTLMLCLSRVYFAVHKDVNVSDGKNILRNLKAMKYCYYDKYHSIQPSLLSCEWKSPYHILRLLEQQGFERVSKERTGSEISLSLRGRNLRKKIGNNKYLYVGNNLNLDPSTLTVEKWKIQSSYPLTCYLLHGFPSANDIVMRSNVSRFITVEDILKKNTDISPMWTEPGLNGLIERTATGFRLLQDDSSVKCITESAGCERIHFRYKDVNFIIKLAHVKYYFYISSTREFILGDDSCCEAKIEISLKSTRSNLIEAATRLATVLFLFENDSDILPLTTSPQFIVEEDGVRIPALDIQAILRLRNEQGSLQKLLGLPDNASTLECRSKSEEIKAIMENNRNRGWVRNMNLHLQDLMMKLTDACAVVDISL